MKPLLPSVREALERATAKFEAALDGSPAADYLTERGITPEAARHFRLGYVPDADTPGFERFRGKLAIPNIVASGTVAGAKFRTLMGDEPKYDAPAGQHARLFNLRAAAGPGDTIVVTEGELDTVTLWMYGIAAVAVPGTNNWKKHHRSIFEGFRKVVLLRDSDDPGGELAKKMLNTDLPVIVIAPPGGVKDANDAHLAGLGDRMVAAIKGAAE